MSLILDAIILAIILLFVILSARKGFVRTLVEVIGFICAIIIAPTISTSLIKLFYDNTNKQHIINLLSGIVSIVVGIVLFFIVKIIAKYINKIFSFSVIGNLNKLLGAILGAVKGIAISVIFCMLISIILTFTKNGFLIFTVKAIDSSYLFKFLMEFSPFI